MHVTDFIAGMGAAAAREIEQPVQVTAALWRGRNQRIYNVSDDSELKMGEYFDLVADAFALRKSGPEGGDGRRHGLVVGALVGRHDLVVLLAGVEFLGQVVDPLVVDGGHRVPPHDLGLRLCGRDDADGQQRGSGKRLQFEHGKGLQGRVATKRIAGQYRRPARQQRFCHGRRARDKGEVPASTPHGRPIVAPR